MQYENKILNFHIYLYFPSNIFKKFKNIKIKGLTYYILTCIISLVFTRNKSKHTIQYARVAQWWSTSLPRRGSRVRSPSRALFNFKRKPAFKRLPFLFVFNLFEDNLKTHDSSSCTLLSTVISHTQSLCLKPFPGHHCLQLP